MDFVLWKPSTPELPGWDSPWGRGRPGWHIECSAMGEALLGPTFDIHGGGIDLVFPHHENEIAQSECVHGGAPLAQVWMHNGFLQVEGEKMAKSLGNFVTIRQLLENWNWIGWPGEALRFNMLRTQYRQPMDWTFNGLDESHKILWDWYGLLEGKQPAPNVPSQIVDALCDDLNTPQLVTELHKLKGEDDYSKLLSALLFLGFSGERGQIGRIVSAVGSASGMSHVTGVGKEIHVPAKNVAARAHAPTVITTPLSKAEIEKQIAARDAAKRAKNFVEADRIRDELAKKRVVLKDNKDGTTTWEVAR
jgi:cysteinyl-tRNA synthetase